jgi:antirestriction protein ArdC
MSFDLYQTVTDQIVAMLETGVVPWRSPILGRSSAGYPKNLISARQYRGVNTFFVTFSQCTSRNTLFLTTRIMAMRAAVVNVPRGFLSESHQFLQFGFSGADNP